MADEFSTQVRQVWAAVHSPSTSEALTFPQTVGRLAALGVTRYHVDYVARTVTAYRDLPFVGTRVDVALTPALESVDKEYDWDVEKVKESIRLVQQGKLNYAEFSREVIEGGVVDYWAYLSGKRVVYCGALGDMHVEWFPGQGPKKD